MILIFEPSFPFLRYCKIKDGDLTVDSIKFKTNWLSSVLKILKEVNDIEAIGYLLPHGGSQIQYPVNKLSSEILAKVGKSIKFFPEHNNIIFKISKYLMSKYPVVPQFLFCDTAFFINLPAEASTYAVPHQLYKKGIRRYGAYGLCHESSWEKTFVLGQGSVQKLISVYLGNQTNICAIKNGKPVETTIGFTPVEGIPSLTSCGDIDPTIIFQLYSMGMTLGEINQCLTEKSGFSGLSGKKLTYTEILKEEDNPSGTSIKKIYIYNIIKYIGAFMAILGGADAIVFITEYFNETKPVILEICNLIDILEIKDKLVMKEDKDMYALTDVNAKTKIFCLNYDKWRIMTEKIRAMLDLKGGK